MQRERSGLLCQRDGGVGGLGIAPSHEVDARSRGAQRVDLDRRRGLGDHHGDRHADDPRRDCRADRGVAAGGDEHTGVGQQSLVLGVQRRPEAAARFETPADLGVLEFENHLDRPVDGVDGRA